MLFRFGADVVTDYAIDCFQAISGCEIEITGIDGSDFKVSVPPGIQPGSVMRLAGQGLWQYNSSHRGNLLVKISITIPQNLSSNQLDLVKQIQNSQ